MQVSTGVYEGVRVVAVAGEIDVASSPALRDALIPWVEAQHPVVIVDMSGVTFLDSTGISALVTFHKRFRSYGGELRIVVTDHNVSKVLSITAVDQVLAIFNTLQEAASPASQRAS